MATIEVKLKPFTVPNYVVAESCSVSRETISVPLNQLTEDAFHDLVRDWLTSVYDKAGKPYNWRFD